jgi:NAD(P)-dependent dehydrogenase (short-subunit alcohol dehydrogenase family)
MGEPGPRPAEHDEDLLRERTAIVTGGGRGLGRAIALAYARAGADVVVTAARSREEVAQVAAESEGMPGTVHPLEADVTSVPDVDRLVEQTLRIRGRIDVLVNNAARGMKFVNPSFMTDPKPFYMADIEDWKLVIDTNITGVFIVSRAVAPHMVGAGEGHIINVTINQDTMVRRGFSPYGPSKAALEAMTQAWAADLEGTGVVVNMLAPGGATATGMIPEGFDVSELLDPEIVVPGALHLATTSESGQRIVGTDFPAR